MALDAVGDPDRALAVFADMQRTRHRSGAYWTGVVYGDSVKGDVFWPGEQTTYTAAAVILAADALGERHGQCTAGSGIMRATSLPEPPEFALECGCTSAPVSR
jgi:hypothetical protein